MLRILGTWINGPRVSRCFAPPAVGSSITWAGQEYLVVQLAGASSISLVNELLLVPSDYHNWSPDERHKWRQDNMEPPTLTNWASWSVMQAGGGAETNKA